MVLEKYGLTECNSAKGPISKDSSKLVAQEQADGRIGETLVLDAIGKEEQEMMV